MMSHTTSNILKVDVAIVGGNIIGAAMALALQKIGLSVALIEKTPPSANPFKQDEPYSLRVSAIIPVVKNLLQELGVWQRLLSNRVQDVQQMHVWEKDLKHALNFNQTDSKSPPFSPVAWIVENNHIQHTCWQVLDETPCHQIIGEWQKITPLHTQQGYKITVNTIEDSQPITIQSQLLIAADGAKSAIRQWSGILSTQRPYHQHCIVGNVCTEKSHQQTAWQHYHQGLAFAFLPLANEACSIAWYVDENESEFILTQSPKQQQKMMHQASGGMLGEIKEIHQLAAFPIIRADAHQLYSENLVLIGDAIRTIHPMAGQGVNLGLCDVAVLSDILHHAYQHNIAINEPLLLKKYARQRSEYKILQNGMDAINGFFKNSIMTPVRPSMLKQLNKFSLGKQFLIEVAMGYHNHLPKKLKKLN